MAPHGKPLPMDLLKEGKKDRMFSDVETREAWSIDPSIVYQCSNKLEALIQTPGNWRILKWRKTNELYDCI